MAKIPKERILELTERIDNNANQIKDVADILLKPYLSSLDDFMVEILDRVRDKNNSLTADELNNYMTKIPVEVYFAIEGTAVLGVKEDVAKAIRNELYNEAHLDAYGTVDTKKSIAELAVLEDTIIQSAYTRANQLLKQKIEAVYETLNSIKASFKRETIKLDIARSENGRR